MIFSLNKLFFTILRTFGTKKIILSFFFRLILALIIKYPPLVSIKLKIFLSKEMAYNSNQKKMGLFFDSD